MSIPPVAWPDAKSLTKRASALELVRTVVEVVVVEVWAVVGGFEGFDASEKINATAAAAAMTAPDNSHAGRRRRALACRCGVGAL